MHRVDVVTSVYGGMILRARLGNGSQAVAALSEGKRNRQGARDQIHMFSQAVAAL